MIRSLKGAKSPIPLQRNDFRWTNDGFTWKKYHIVEVFKCPMGCFFDISPFIEGGLKLETGETVYITYFDMIEDMKAGNVGDFYLPCQGILHFIGTHMGYKPGQRTPQEIEAESAWHRQCQEGENRRTLLMAEAGLGSDGAPFGSEMPPDVYRMLRRGAHK